jgi:molybdenum cofactor biosynthesis enzyme MoaA
MSDHPSPPQFPYKYASGMLEGKGKVVSVVGGINQTQDPFKDLPEYNPKRLTNQWLNACNLACPGCYAKPDLAHGRKIDTSNRRPLNKATNSRNRFEEHVLAHGSSIHQVYVLGLEPTLTPVHTKIMLDQAQDMGLSAVTATNGANGVSKFETAYKDALERGQLHRINISIDDAIDARVNDILRGKAGAQTATLGTIKHCIDQGYPIQITMTVWAENLGNIVESVKKLQKMGVRALKLHEGSLEGAPDFQDTGVNRVDPLSWRALTTEVHKMKLQMQQDGEMQTLVIPTIYLTAQELADTYIGDEQKTLRYLTHVNNVEEGVESKMPFIGCPGVNADQTYLWGNDGKFGAGAVGLCSIDTFANETYLADYDPRTKKFVTEKNPQRNQIARMQASKNMCPAFSGASRDEAKARGERLSDRHQTLAGDLYHTCRLVSNNHIETDMTFGQDYYEGAVSYSSFLKSREDWRMSDEVVRIHRGALPFEDKISAIRELEKQGPKI